LIYFRNYGILAFYAGYAGNLGIANLGVIKNGLDSLKNRSIGKK
jgi:hypothetical protein